MANFRKEFGEIYDQYIDKIYRFVFLKVNSEEVAQDLCSETFLKGWSVFQSGTKIENMRAFLYRIARNLVTDYYRQKGRTNTVSVDSLPISDPSPNFTEKIFINSDIDQVKKALGNINEDYQNIIILHYLNDLPVSELAVVLDKSEQAVRVMLHRALKSLKNEFPREEV